MKLLAVFALLGAVMALVGAEAAAKAEPESPQTGELDVAKRCYPRRCPCGWTKIGHRCFLFVAHPLPWALAEASCRARGAHLASVHSLWEYNKIRCMIKSRTHHHPQAWLGGNDRCQEGIWRWSDGTCFNYRRWCCGEPNNCHNQDCLQMNFGHGKCWDDRQCHHCLPFVCARHL